MRLTEEQLRARRQWLAEFREPDEVVEFVRQTRDEMGSAEFFHQAGGQFLRDAWLAGKFGVLHACDRVRLLPDGTPWPDFEAKKGESCYQIECVEADLPNRRRGDEYRNQANLVSDSEFPVENDPYENWIVRRNSIHLSLDQALKRKIDKFYSSKCPFAGLSQYRNIR